MMQAYASLALLVASAAGQAPAPGPAPMRESATAYDECWHMCKHASGLGASDCMTDCRAYTDVAPDKSEALNEFVADQGYNKAGGDSMEEAFDERHPKHEDVDLNYLNGLHGHKDCQPTFSGTPEFKDADLNGDGVITPDEAAKFGEKMCVSSEMVMQIFDMADSNRDKEVHAGEWDKVGENTEAEQALDHAVDPLSQGDEEYARTKLPRFEEFDGNSDGVLDEHEMDKVLMFELRRRFPGLSDEELLEKASDVMEELSAMAGHLDGDGDGNVSREEFHAEAERGEDMGDEFKEEEEAYHDKQQLDDAKRVEHPTMVPVPEDYLPGAPAPAASPAAVALHARSSVRRLRGGRGRGRGVRAPRQEQGNWIRRVLAQRRR